MANDVLLDGSGQTLIANGAVTSAKMATNAAATNLGSSTLAVSVNTQNITNVVDPVNPQDAATKHYVDNAPAGTQYSQTLGITAHAGGGQGSAVLLTSYYNQVDTVGTLGDSVKLPVITAGKSSVVVVRNTAINGIDIYPQSGDNIDNASANTPILLLPSGTGFAVPTIVFTSSGANSWISSQSYLMDITQTQSVFGPKSFESNAEFGAKATFDDIVELDSAMIFPPLTKSGNYTIGFHTNDHVIDVTGGSPTLTLPSAAAGAVGQEYQIYDSSGASNPNITIATSSGSQFINGTLTSIVLNQPYQSVTLRAEDNTHWVTTAGYIPSEVPVVSARYYASTTSISGSLTTVVWSTMDYDTNSSMSSGVYTVPVAGKYSVTSSLALTQSAGGGTATIQIQKNGTATSSFDPATSTVLTSPQVSISDIISCSVGDTIQIQVSYGSATPSIVASNIRNYISLCRLGA